MLRIILCAIAAGLLSATTVGIAITSDGQSTRWSIEPVSALGGFLAGFPVGAAAGYLVGRRGLAKATGILLVTIIGGAAGVLIAGLTAAESRMTVTNSATTMGQGASPGTLIAGAVLGLVLGGLTAWLIGRQKSPGRPVLQPA